VAREDNRHAFPLTAAAVDLFTAVFGPVRVRYTSEGGREVGRRDAPGPDDAMTGRQLSERYDEIERKRVADKLANRARQRNPA
jgi:hypothetical protein